MKEFFDSLDPLAVNAIIAVAVVTLLDFVTGVLRAVADSTFAFSAVDVWVRKHLLGRVVPIVLIITVGQFVGTITIGDVSLSLLGAAGLAGAVTVVGAGINSIIGNLNRFLPIATTVHPVPIE